MRDRLPLVLGATGDKDLEVHDPKIATIVADRLKDFHKRFPNTPLLIISSLAEGAAQLIPDTAFNLQKDPEIHQLEVELIVALPVDEAAFLATFSTDEVRNKFHDLKDKARRTVRIPNFIASTGVGSLPGGVSAFEVQLFLAGAYVARNCHLLLAIYDKNIEGKVGGPASIVDFKRTGRLDAQLSALEKVHEVFGTGFEPLEVPDAGPVDWIELPYNPAKKPPVERLPPTIYEEDQDEKELYLELIKLIYGTNIERFNEESTQIDKKRGSNWINEIAARRSGKKRLKLPKDLRDCLRTYATADQAALKYQNRLGRMMTYLLILIVAAVGVFGAYAHLVKEQLKPALLVIYLLLLIFADVLFILATKSDALFDTVHDRWIYTRDKWFRWLPAPKNRPRAHDTHKPAQDGNAGKTKKVFEDLRSKIVHWFHGRDDQKRYQDYRTLCEGLRVQFYWRLAGLTDSVGDYYLTRQKNELDWIHSSVRSWAILIETPKPSATNLPPETERLLAVKQNWVLHQLNYYIKSADINRLSHITFREIGAGLLFSSILVSFVVAVGGMKELEQWNLFVKGLIAFGLAVAGIHYIAKRLEMDKEAREDVDELRKIERHAKKDNAIKQPDGLDRALRDLAATTLLDQPCTLLDQPCTLPDRRST